MTEERSLIEYDYKKIAEQFREYLIIRMGYLESEECNQSDIVTVSKLAEIHRVALTFSNLKLKNSKVYF